MAEEMPPQDKAREDRRPTGKRDGKGGDEEGEWADDQCRAGT